jgi:uncharacterized protein involved in exopolysaccharide biosynthesis
MRLLLLLPLLSLVAGCGDDLSSPKGVAEAQADAFNDLAAVLDTIKDEASAKAAKSKAEAIYKRLEEAEAAMVKLALTVSEGDMQDMKEAQAKLSAAQQKKAEAVGHLHQRIKDDPAAIAVVDQFLR